MDILSGQFDPEKQRDYLDLCIETAYNRASRRQVSQARAYEDLVRCYVDFVNDGGLT